MVNIHQGHDESNIIEFLTAFKMMIAFYFGAKVMHHVTSTDRAKVEIKAQQSIAEATKATHSGAESETSSSEGSDFEDPDAAM